MLSTPNITDLKELSLATPLQKKKKKNLIEERKIQETNNIP